MGSPVLTLGSQCVWLPCWCGGRREWRDDHPDWQWRNSGAWPNLSVSTVQMEGGRGGGGGGGGGVALTDYTLNKIFRGSLVCKTLHMHSRRTCVNEIKMEKTSFVPRFSVGGV